MFENIIGQSNLKKYLELEINNNNISYGYIIEGQKFMGKQFIATEFGKTLTNYVTVVTPEVNESLSIEDIRNLKEDAYTYSYNGANKVYIIPNADTMNIPSQNAFLKLLEEPPQDCIFILLVENRYSLLETIRSRCVLLLLKEYTEEEIIQYLKLKGITNIDKNLVKMCGGTLKYEYLSSDEFKPIKELAFKILLNINQLHDSRVFAILKHIKQYKNSINEFLDLFLLWYRDLYTYKLTKDINLIEFNEYTNQIIAISEYYTEQQLNTIIDQIILAKNKLKYNCNFDMVVDVLLLYMKGVI